MLQVGGKADAGLSLRLQSCFAPLLSQDWKIKIADFGLSKQLELSPAVAEKGASAAVDRYADITFAVRSAQSSLPRSLKHLSLNPKPALGRRGESKFPVPCPDGVVVLGVRRSETRLTTLKRYAHQLDDEDRNHSRGK